MYGQDKFYNDIIPQSLRFDDGDSAYLTRTNSSAGNRRTWTFSAWVKVANIGSGTQNYILGGTTDNYNLNWAVFFFGSDELTFYSYTSTQQYQINTGDYGVFRDPSAWYHLVLAWDTTQATASDRIKLYINGVRFTNFDTAAYPAQNYEEGYINNNIQQDIGKAATANKGYDGYMAEVHFVDGTAYTPTAFGETKEGIWIPKQFTGTYGTNGYHFDFGNGSALGNDNSGNNNDFTPNGLAATNVVPDSPENNFGTMNPLDKNSMTVSNGNLKVVPSADYRAIRGTFGIPTSGKWYFEARILTPGGGNVQDNQIGVVTSSNVLTGTSPYPQSFTYGVGYLGSGNINRAGSNQQTGLTAFTAGKILGVAVNVDDNQVQFYLDGVAVGTTHALVSTTEPNFPFYVGATNRGAVFNFGQDSTFDAARSAGGNADANGIGDFAYAPPAGFLSLCSSNLPNPGIDPNDNENPTDHFNTVLYTGTGSSLAVTGVGFQPDWVWVKNRGTTNAHVVYDSVRGPALRIYPSSTAAEATGGLTSFDTDGFTVNGSFDTEGGSSNYVAWNWKAGGTAVTNNDGDIQSQVSANVKAGFSIVSWTADGSQDNRVGHGLNSAPELVIYKARTYTGNQSSWHWRTEVIDGTNDAFLWQTNDDAFDVDVAYPVPTSTTIGNYGYNNGSTMIAYCFHSIDGFSKIGKYVANNSTDGPFVYTGFRPAWVQTKADLDSMVWGMFDNKRETFNVRENMMAIAGAPAEPYQTQSDIDFLSNGFKFRDGATSWNNYSAGATYVYWAFASQPFKYANAE